MDAKKNGDKIEEEEGGCKTPRHRGSSIPLPSICPPAPKKRRVYMKQQSAPKEGYFNHPDIEVFFAIFSSSTRERCV
ncbi:hypothetical protein LIER_28908 [Lithospermum erythrorhizon]|uniref:Uncharacterized protein n=1 Tax=Lithospermum erythrorhizon TaxID=34254 RepID=A0AAV3RHD5_LITER